MALWHGLCYSTIHDPTIHDLTMYDSCKNYIEKTMHWETIFCETTNVVATPCELSFLHNIAWNLAAFFSLVKVYIWNHSFVTFAKLYVRNISLSENFANVLNEWSLYTCWIADLHSPATHLIEKQNKSKMKLAKSRLPEVFYEKGKQLH